MRVEITERLRIVTPLGIKFWDVAIDRQVREGLYVTARPETTGRPVVVAKRTASDLYAFHHLPGLREREFVLDDWQAGMPIPETRRYIIRVEDLLGRFLPIAFLVEAPFDGVFPEVRSEQSPPSAAGFDLFPQVSRAAPNGLAEIRADLWDIDGSAPAAHAVLEVTTEQGSVYHGISDAAGKVAVFFPCPPVSVSLSGSPQIGTKIALSEQTWTVRISISYAPALVTGFPNISEPNFRTILEQTQGVLFSNGSASGVSDFDQQLDFGRPTILRTNGGSTLLVSSGDSPP